MTMPEPTPTGRERARNRRDRARRLRMAIHLLLKRGPLSRGDQVLLARHFGVSRQRVHQVVVDERQRIGARAH